MAKPQPRMLEVLGTEHITPNMLRVNLGGDGLNGFPEGREGGYVKFVFPDAPRTNPERPVMRTYSVRAYDPAAGVLTVDFALHGDSGGIATDWALNAQVGDQILVGGPGTVKMASPEADWVLLAGDMTAFPALMCNFLQLPSTAKGYAVIEITSEADKQDLGLPAGVEVHWVVTPSPEKAEGRLVERIKSLPWLAGDVFVWTACEFDAMRALRSYYRNDRGVGRDQIYLSSYWRAGRTEDQHKIDKQKEATAAAA
ncbi:MULTISPECIES: siderophore-interacting protein [unclassified Shimia]|uniref:siderophore-interacting protein n=1 Tax=unclassified Shimia TaxID=2630038 RepID=UPI00310343DC